MQPHVQLPCTAALASYGNPATSHRLQAAVLLARGHGRPSMYKLLNAQMAPRRPPKQGGWLETAPKLKGSLHALGRRTRERSPRPPQDPAAPVMFCLSGLAADLCCEARHKQPATAGAGRQGDSC